MKSNEDSTESIENLESHAVNIELKWQRFLALITEIEEKISDMDKSVSKDEKYLDVKEEPIIAEIVVVISATTSHDGASLVKNTKVEKIV